MMHEELLARIRVEGEKTRLHMDAWAERLEPYLRMIADAHADILRMVADHESRRQSLEKRP